MSANAGAGRRCGRPRDRKRIRTATPAMFALRVFAAVQVLNCLTVSVTRWWAGVDNAHYIEKCPGEESSPFSGTNPTTRVHALLGGHYLTGFLKIQLPTLIPSSHF
jgi:hypothetical protein